MLLFPVRFFIQQLIIFCLADRICRHVGARVPRVFLVSRAYSRLLHEHRACAFRTSIQLACLAR